MMTMLNGNPICGLLANISTFIHKNVVFLVIIAYCFIIFSATSFISSKKKMSSWIFFWFMVLPFVNNCYFRQYIFLSFKYFPFWSQLVICIHLQLEFAIWVLRTFCCDVIEATIVAGFRNKALNESRKVFTLIA